MKLSKRELKYLQTIKKLCEVEGSAKLSSIAKQLLVSPSSAYDEVNHLIEKGYVKRDLKGISLTNEGEKILRDLIRSHRILESFLFKIGFSTELACRYANELDHIMPLEVVEKLYDYLGKPAKCPHGEEII
jgi:Mn-dependent DtxR family transcriptional regulator